MIQDEKEWHKWKADLEKNRTKAEKLRKENERMSKENQRLLEEVMKDKDEFLPEGTIFDDDNHFDGDLQKY